MQDIVVYDDGVVAVDSGYGDRSRLAAVHLVVDNGRVAVIDTATNASLPHILAMLARLNIPPEAVDWVILTHLHLDHAGGAGSMMCALPRAQLVAHPLGRRYLVEPTLLWERSVELYGAERTFRFYGCLIPVDGSRIVDAWDGQELSLGERTLRLLAAPGHSRDHIVVWDEVAQAFFTGDAFGVSYRELDADGREFIFPSTSPHQFEPDDMLATIERMLAFCPQAMYLSRFGRVREVARLGVDLYRLIHAHIAVAQAARGEGVARHVDILSGLEQLVREECARQQWGLDEEAALELLRLDLAFNAQGLGMWLDDCQRSQSAVAA
ncbi:MBL fold metallo-hydrolase [Betaproteobacteria bacterium]|nr:MBL fold metallo-hydrolase [Betaproteobacteria bacterium]